MPCILPVSDLRNYNEVLQNVTEESPVFLTKNGRGCYVVIDIKEYERMVAALKLQKELTEGEQSAERNGWLTAADVRKKYRV
jgi:prevent-host-death family protein